MQSRPPTVRRTKMGVEMKRKFKLGEILVESKRLSQEQIDAALKRSREAGMMLGETLIEMGMLKSLELLRIVGQQLGLPAVELRAGLIDSESLQYLPKDKANY